MEEEEWGEELVMEGERILNVFRSFPFRTRLSSPDGIMVHLAATVTG